MSKMLVLALAVVLVPHPAAGGRHRHPSRDGSQEAVVVDVGKPGFEETESSVEIWSNGRLVTHRSYKSADGEHGFGVVKVAWTRDSRYLLLSLRSSGGHQPWHVPLVVYSTQTRSFHDVEPLVGAVTSPFDLLVDGSVRVTVLNPATQTFDLVKVFRPERVASVGARRRPN